MKAIRVLFFVAFFIFGTTSVYSQSYMNSSQKQISKVYKGEMDPCSLINYLLYLPNGYDQDKEKTWPLILFLHGSGERGDDVNLVKVHGPPKIMETKNLPFIVISPQCPIGEWWTSEILMELLDAVIIWNRVDTSRVYLTGLSMGGYGTWSLAIQYPDKFAAIAPICGGGDPSQAEKIKHIPTWVFHGAKDKTIPLIKSKEMVEALQKVNGKVKFTVYPEANHDSWTETYQNKELYDWFLKHSK